MVLVWCVARRTGCRRDRVTSSNTAGSRREISADARQAAPSRAAIRATGSDHIHISIGISVDQDFETLHTVLVTSGHSHRAILTHAGHRAPSARTATFRTRVARQSIPASEFPGAFGTHVRSLARVELRVSLEIVQTTKPCLTSLTEKGLLVRVRKQVRLEIMVPGERLVAVMTGVLASRASGGRSRWTERCGRSRGTESWSSRCGRRKLFGGTAGPQRLHRERELCVAVPARLKE